MKTKSAWSRGLCFGGIFGGVMCLFPLVGVVISNPPWHEVAMAFGVTFLIWGGLGFLAGFCSDGETRPGFPGDLHPNSLGARIKYWLYRFVAGLLLSLIAYSIVGGLGLALMFLWMGDVDAPIKRRVSDKEMQLAFVSLNGFLGIWTGSVAGCWLGAMLVPRGQTLGGVARGAFMTAALGALAGGWVGAAFGLLRSDYLSYEQAIILALIGGTLAGIGGAIVMWLQVFRRASR